MLTYAQEFLKQHIAVIPVKFRDKRPDISSWEPYKTILPTSSQISNWFSNKSSNYGVIMGWQDLLVLDFDDLQEYQRWQVWCSKTAGLAQLVSELAFKVTTSRGVHVYIRLSNQKNQKLGKIDIKANGYVLGPGSIHPTGAIYRALGDKLFFPRVNNLIDILPVELLVSHTERVGLVRDPTRAQPQTSLDPWLRAMQGSKADSGLVEKIRDKLKILDFFPQSSPTSADHRWWVTRCPFHDDKSPSFWIDSRDSLCGCFAGCTDKPMDVINLYSRLYGISNLDAIRLLSGGIS
jgi:hypothetical protein